MITAKKFVFFTSLLLASVLLASCGGGSSEKSSDSAGKEEFIEAPAQEVQATGGFDTPITTPDGQSYSLSSPASFTPGKFASGLVIGQSFNQFSVTVKNGGTKELDLVGLIVTGTTASGTCVDIFDGDNKMEGAPQAPLAVGASITFNWALSCAGKSGEDLSIILTNSDAALIEAKGKLS